MRDYIFFKPSAKPLNRETENDICFLFKENKLILLKDEDHYIFPKRKDLDGDLINTQYMGDYKGDNCLCGEIKGKINNQDLVLMDLMTFSEKVDKDIYMLATKANLLLKWLKANKHCGVCGSSTYLKDSFHERALVCSSCGNTTWPRTSPAVIVAVTKKDKLLLVYNKQFPERKYSVVAGFVEYGESFEESVKREVYEETNIKVKNIRYFGSQPWPFPNSMMVGFTAEYLDGDIEEDGEEIGHAKWFSREEIKDKYNNKYNDSISMGTQLINWFLKEQENHPEP